MMRRRHLIKQGQLKTQKTKNKMLEKPKDCEIILNNPTKTKMLEKRKDCEMILNRTKDSKNEK